MREVDAGLWATAKDKWNSELQSNVRRLQEVDWTAVGQRIEGGMERVWRKAFEKGKEEIGK